MTRRLVTICLQVQSGIQFRGQIVRMFSEHSRLDNNNLCPASLRWVVTSGQTDAAVAGQGYLIQAALAFSQTAALRYLAETTRCRP